jgi:hypothetical protein
MDSLFQRGWVKCGRHISVECILFCNWQAIPLPFPFHKVSKVFHRDAGPCWLQCLPQLCQVGCMSSVWSTILDTHGKLLSVKNPVLLQFLNTFKPGAPGTYYHSTWIRDHSFHLDSSCTQSMSRKEHVVLSTQGQLVWTVVRVPNSTLFPLYCTLLLTRAHGE